CAQDDNNLGHRTGIFLTPSLRRMVAFPSSCKGKGDREAVGKGLAWLIDLLRAGYIRLIGRL
ncbi:MAG: hypothetical protein MUO76_00375, partial [Anaerolineaceae bacterium]|nr:hypothetical protein [Anaerolineaceae bacterium]